MLISKATMTRKSRDRTMGEGAAPRDGGSLHHRNGQAASRDGAREESRACASAPGARNAAAWPDVVVDPAPGADRIAKMMARAGLCSRRDAEAWIAAGRVAVNGTTIASPAVNVTARDRIMVDGEPLPRRERTRLFLFHKPERPCQHQCGPARSANRIRCLAGESAAPRERRTPRHRHRRTAAANQ